MTHDSMCLAQELLPADLARFCDCERVIRIRADERTAERERLATEVEEMAPRWNDYAVPRSRVRSVVSFIRGGEWW